MKTFKRYIREENDITFGTSSGVFDVNDDAVRDNVNNILTMTMARKYVTPYIALERVAKVLANFHIFLPKYTYLEGDSGMAVFDVKQFGDKMGMTDDGQFIKEVPATYHVYFEYQMADSGMFEIFCEVVSKAELDEIMSDVEDEMEESEKDELKEASEKHVHPVEPETGEIKIPGSNQEPLPKAPVPAPPKKRTDAEMEKKKLGEESGYYFNKMSSINELSAELVGKVNKARLEKPSKTKAAGATLTRAVRKKWLESEVGKLKEDEHVEEAAKWRSTSVAKKITDPDDGEYHQGYHIDNPRSTGIKQATSDIPLKPGSLMTRSKAKVTSQGARKGMATKAHIDKLKRNIHLNRYKEKEQLDELSKKTLGSYIKKASHDVATKSAATGRYAERANKEEDNRKKNKDYSGYQQGRKDNAFADKMFNKSWKRREGIAKAVDKLTKEEALNELSTKLKARYVKKATADKTEAERQADHSEHTAKHAEGKEKKAGFKKEAEWLRGIAAKRAKGIEIAKKKV